MRSFAVYNLNNKMRKSSLDQLREYLENVENPVTWFVIVTVGYIAAAILSIAIVLFIARN